MKSYKSIIVLIIILIATNSYATSGREIIGNIKKNFKKLNTYSLTFKQTQYLEFTNDSTLAEGKIFYKKDDTFRIEQEKNFIISDGKTIYRYSSQTNQVLIEEVKEDKDLFLPGKLFYDFTDNYDLSDYFKKGKATVLKMVSPEGEEKFINSLLVYVDKDNYVFRVDYFDLDDNKTKIEFINRKINPKLDNNIFIFKAKAGVDIQDLR